MKFAPRYCRSCGSRILVRNICHNCGNNPIHGKNYCYDCGALTPDGSICLSCGAVYKNKTYTSSIIIGGILTVAIAIACFFIFKTSEAPQKQEQQITKTVTNSPEVKNNVPIKNTPSINVTPDTTSIKPADSPKIIQKTIIDSVNREIKEAIDSEAAKRVDASTFTSAELSLYKFNCSYFEKKQKNNIIFLTSNAVAYIKLNNKIYTLKRTFKSSDLLKFSGEDYEAVITIDGLAGNAAEWLAAGTLSVRNITQKSSSKYKIYSKCIAL